MKILKFLQLVFCLAIFPEVSFSQSEIKDILLKSDSLTFSFKENTVVIDHSSFLSLSINDKDPVIDISIKNNPNIKKLSLISTDDYSVIDSLKLGADQRYFGKIKFFDVVNRNMPILKFNVVKGNEISIEDVKLFCITKPQLNYFPENHEVFLEKQKTIEIPVVNGFNIRTENLFITGKDFDYKINLIQNVLILTIKPHNLGNKQIRIPIKSISPFLENSQLTYDLPPINISLNVKPFKLTFLNFDKTTIFFSQDFKERIQLLADFNPFFESGKTYRIEDQQNSGGTLIAELYVESVLENSKKVLCRIRPFSLHKISDGYLYIKDAEKNRFISNLNIIEKPQISKVYIRKEGGDWDEDLTVYPNENLEIRLEGKGLLSNKIQFENIAVIKMDSSMSYDEMVFYKLKIPLSISNKRVAIFLNKKESQFRLNVKDYQKPKSFDFVSINYGSSDISLNHPKLNKPIFIENVIKDINLIFDPNKIDENNKLFGKQYFSIEVKLLNKDDDLIEIQKIEDLTVCPGETSLRKNHYDQSDCKQENINLNDYLDHKTYNLPAFTQIIITLSHNENKYETKGFTKRIRFILERKYNVDLQLSFPTGLLVKYLDEKSIGSLSGISASVLLNISSYDRKQFGKLRPFSVGAGFLALNALNLSSTSTSDVGVVIMGNIQPLRKNAKFSVPIYLGGGYFVKQGRWFLIFGPGLQFNF